MYSLNPWGVGLAQRLIPLWYAIGIRGGARTPRPVKADPTPTTSLAIGAATRRLSKHF